LEENDKIYGSIPIIRALLELIFNMPSRIDTPSFQVCVFYALGSIVSIINPDNRIKRVFAKIEHWVYRDIKKLS